MLRWLYDFILKNHFSFNERLTFLTGDIFLQPLKLTFGTALKIYLLMAYFKIYKSEETLQSVHNFFTLSWKWRRTGS